MAWEWDSRWGWRDDGEWPEPDYATPLFDQVCQDTGAGDEQSAVYREGARLDGLVPRRGCAGA